MIGFIGTSVQLQLIITAHNQGLSKTHSIPYWTTSVFSSAVIDLVLIYELVASCTAIACWLTLHSWTSEFSYDWIFELPYECQMTELSWTELTSRQTKYKSPCLTVPLLFCCICCHGNVTYRNIIQQWIIPWLFIAAKTCLPNRCLAMVIFVTILTSVWKHLICEL
jgi:hypothetical protein